MALQTNEKAVSDVHPSGWEMSLSISAVTSLCLFPHLWLKILPTKNNIYKNHIVDPERAEHNPEDSHNQGVARVNGLFCEF